MLVLLLEPDTKYCKLNVKLPTGAKVERRYSFEFIGQNLTLVPHLLASGDDALKQVKLAQTANKGDVLLLVYSNDSLILNLAAKLQTKVISYDADLSSLVLADDLAFRSIRSFLDTLPIGAIILNENFQPLVANQIISKYVDSRIPNISKVLQSLLTKLELDKSSELDFLNFSGYALLKRLSFLNNNYIVCFLLDFASASDQLSHFDLIVNLGIDYLTLKTFDHSSGKSVRKILSEVIFELDKLVPEDTEIIMEDFADFYLPAGEAEFRITCFLSLLKIICMLGSFTRLEIEMYSKVNDSNVLIFSGYRKRAKNVEFIEMTYLKAVSELLGRFLNKIDEDMERNSSNLFKTQWNFSDGKVSFSLKI